MGKISQRERDRQLEQLTKISGQLGRMLGTGKQLQAAIPEVEAIVTEVQASVQAMTQSIAEVTQGFADMTQDLERQRVVNLHLIAQLTGQSVETVLGMESQLRGQFDGKKEGL